MYIADNLTVGGTLTASGLISDGSAATGITAGTTRTRTGATALVKQINRVDTSTAPSAGSSLGDGVVLQAAAAGSQVIVWNNTANLIQLYAAGSDTLNGVAGATGIPVAQNAGYICVAAATGGWIVLNAGEGTAGAIETFLALGTISAVNPISQSTATALPATINRVTTVSASGAAVALPATAAGIGLVVINGTANNLTIFPVNSGTDAINGLSANASVVLPGNGIAVFYCDTVGVWTSAPFMNGAGAITNDLISTGNTQSTATLTATTNTVLASITGLSVTLTGGATYNFRIRLNGTSGATGGVKVALGGTATATALNATTWQYNGTTLSGVTNITSLASNLTNIAAIYTDIISEGCIVVNAGGTLTVQGAQNTSNGTSTTFLNGGCYLEVWRVS